MSIMIRYGIMYECDSTILDDWLSSKLIEAVGFQIRGNRIGFWKDRQ